MLQKKRESEARLLWANKPDKLQQAKDEITEVSSIFALAQCGYIAGSSLSTAPIPTRCLGGPQQAREPVKGPGLMGRHLRLI